MEDSSTPGLDRFSGDTDEDPTLLQARSGLSVGITAMGSERTERWFSIPKMEELIALVRASDDYRSVVEEGKQAGDYDSRWDSRVAFALEDAYKAFAVFAHTIQDICSQVRIPFSNFSVPHDEICSALSHLVTVASRGAHYIEGIKRYKYINKKGSPFHTDMAILHAPVNEYYNVRHTLSFTMDYLREAYKRRKPVNNENMFDDQHFVSFQTKSRIPVQRGSYLSRSDQVICSVEGEYATQIAAGKLLEDIQKFYELEKRYPLNPRHQLVQVPRELLNI